MSVLGSTRVNPDPGVVECDAAPMVAPPHNKSFGLVVVIGPLLYEVEAVIITLVDVASMAFVCAIPEYSAITKRELLTFVLVE